VNRRKAAIEDRHADDSRSVDGETTVTRECPLTRQNDAPYRGYTSRSRKPASAIWRRLRSGPRTRGWINAHPRLHRSPTEGGHSGWHREISLERPAVDRAAARSVRGRGRRGVLWCRPRRQPLCRAGADQHRQCRPAGHRLELSHRRSRPARRGSAAPLEIRSDADPGRRQAAHLHAVQRGDRARSRRRPRALALRSEDRDGLPAGQSVRLPRRRLLARFRWRGRTLRDARPDRDQ
jgi:hypothetical protein